MNMATANYKDACRSGFTATSIQSGAHDDSQHLEARLVTYANKNIDTSLYPLLIVGGAMAARNQSVSLKLSNSHAIGNSDIDLGTFDGRNSHTIKHVGSSQRWDALNYLGSVQLVSNGETTKIVLSWNF